MPLEVLGTTKLLGVLGNPVGHSLSPVLHNFSADLLGINSVYLPLEFASTDLHSLLRSLWDLGFLGLNITVPFKESVSKVLGDVALKSVNTLYRGEVFWEATSTDGGGFLLALRRILDPNVIENLVIMGNGGASLALASHWNQVYPTKNIVVIRRDSRKDELFKSTLIGPVQFQGWSPKGLASILKNRPMTLLVQATSAPLHGDDLSAFKPVMKDLDGAFVDMLYGPFSSSLYKEASRVGLPAQDGLGMLIGQALQSQEIWWGKHAPFGAVESHLIDFISGA